MHVASLHAPYAYRLHEHATAFKFYYGFNFATISTFILTSHVSFLRVLTLFTMGFFCEAAQFWNNFGLSGEERPTTSIDKMDTARAVLSVSAQQQSENVYPVSTPVKAASSRCNVHDRVFAGTMHHPALTLDNVIGVGSEVEVGSQSRSRKNAKPSKSSFGHVGRMYKHKL